MKATFRILQKMFKGFKRQSLIHQLMQRYGWNYRKASRATTRYQMFLLIAALHPHVTLVPTREIDRVWEEDIITDTHQYLQRCTQLCDRILHHINRADLCKSIGAQELDIAFVHTKALFESYFGIGILGYEENEAAACGCPAAQIHLIAAL